MKCVVINLALKRYEEKNIKAVMSSVLQAEP